MVSKTFLSLITTSAILSAINLLSHDNFNQVSTNVGSSGLDSAHLKINHQSYFYIPNGDALILDLTHGLHTKHMQNDIGLAYRKSFETFGVGANFYYMHTTQPKIFLHQFSPGVELLWKDVQLTYNFYFPASKEKFLRKETLAHASVSELGLRWMPTKELSIGILPHYNHLNKNWGLNSKINYTLKETFVFGVSPYFKSTGSGCLFSFGVNFGPAKGIKSTHRSNEFNYLVKHYHAKNPTISVEMPKPREISTPTPTPAIPTRTPGGMYPVPVPIPYSLGGNKAIEDAPEDKKEPEAKKPEPKNWWESFLESCPKLREQQKVEEKPNSLALVPYEGHKDSLAVTIWKEHKEDLIFIPPMLMLLAPLMSNSCLATSPCA